MNWIELTIYIVMPEPVAFAGVVERQAQVTFKGHPRVVVPLAPMLQQAAQVLGASKAIESQERGQEEAILPPDNLRAKSGGVKDEGNSK